MSSPTAVQLAVPPEPANTTAVNDGAATNDDMVTMKRGAILRFGNGNQVLQTANLSWYKSQYTLRMVDCSNCGSYARGPSWTCNDCGHIYRTCQTTAPFWTTEVDGAAADCFCDKPIFIGEPAGGFSPQCGCGKPHPFVVHADAGDVATAADSLRAA